MSKCDYCDGTTRFQTQAKERLCQNCLDFMPPSLKESRKLIAKQIDKINEQELLIESLKANTKGKY